MSQRTRRRHQRRNGSVGKKILIGLGVVLTVLGIAAGSGVAWVLNVAAGAPSPDSLKPLQQGETSEVFAADGSSLGFVQSTVIRDEAKLENIPQRLQDATIAIEDENFWTHDGVDTSAIIRAAVENFEAGEIRQGASTITQQLVRNLYIENPEDTIERKIEEAAMAREYEQEHSKEEILEAYLNTASYGTNDGRTAVGVKAAARVFFNKELGDLNLTEAALLAGLPQAPTDYNPFINPEGAKQRRNLVLKAMFDQEQISEEKYEAAREKGLGLERGTKYEVRDEQYFFDYVQQELVDTYGTKTVREGGLKVYTTLDPKLQQAAEQAIIDRHTTVGASAALVSTDTDTGEILAMASSEAYENSVFNLAAQGVRQPGSSFKPFVLATAVDQGMDPDSTYYPAPSSITLTTDDGITWPVSGSGGGGSMSLRSATAASINSVYAQLALDVGPENFAEMAHKLGVESPLQGYPAESLGGTAECCTVLEMSNAYATFANGGVHHDATAIRRVEFPNGEVDEPEDPEGNRVLSDGEAYVMADVMKGALEGGGTASGWGIGCPASGKTGTTEEQSDAWFVGYTPHVSTAVWVGNPNERTPLPGYGADLAAPIWNQYMLTAASSPCDDFPTPENPANLTGSGTTTSSYDSSYDTGYDTGVTPTTPEDTVEEVPEPTTDEGFDPDLYAPGAGQEPLPTPDADQGGGTIP